MVIGDNTVIEDITAADYIRLGHDKFNYDTYEFDRFDLPGLSILQNIISDTTELHNQTQSISSHYASMHSNTFSLEKHYEKHYAKWNSKLLRLELVKSYTQFARIFFVLQLHYICIILNALSITRNLVTQHECSIDFSEPSNWVTVFDPGRIIQLFGIRMISETEDAASNEEMEEFNINDLSSSSGIDRAK